MNSESFIVVCYGCNTEYYDVGEPQEEYLCEDCQNKWGGEE